MFKAHGVVFDGFVDIRGAKDEKYNFVTAEQAIAERAFMLMFTPYYDDEFFNLLNDQGCQYGRDYLIVPPELKNFFKE